MARENEPAARALTQAPVPAMLRPVGSIPTLETERLILRPHRPADFADCLALWSDEATVRFIGGHVQDAQAVWFRMLRYAGMWAMLGFGYWLFEEKATGLFVGEGGLADARRGIPLLEGVPEIGWALARDAGGMGFATEAAGAVCRWADEALEAPVLRCIIEPANVASIRVAEKLGFAVAGEAESERPTLLVLERHRP